MKKISASLLAISFFMLIFCGCGDSTEPVRVNNVFTAQAKVKTEDIVMDVEVSASSGGDIAVTVLSPESIKGLSYHRVNSTLYIESGGLKCTTAHDYLTSYNPFEVIIDVISSISLSAPVYKGNEGEELLFSGKSTHGDYDLFVDNSGDILRIVPKFALCEIQFNY